MRIHIVNPFVDAHGGSELRALALFEELRSHAEVDLWSIAPPNAGFARYPISSIVPHRERYPRGGTLVVVGPYFDLDPWLELARPERVVLVYNTYFPTDELKFRTLRYLRRVSDPELVYASRQIAEWVGLPGVVQVSLIDTQAFAPRMRDASGEFVVGRLSRDVPEKHHAADPGLYRGLAAAGMHVRVMGGTCLAAGLAGVAGIELLAAGAQPAPQFLQGLDCFLYRTSHVWQEPAGRVVAEAMSCALPVVCARGGGGYEEWIEHGTSGYLFEGDAQALEILRTLQSDPALRRRVGAAARRKIEELYSPAERRAMVDYYIAPASRAGALPRARRIDFAWELGGHTGHVTTLLPIARGMRARGHHVRFLLRELQSGADLEGAADIPRAAAPIWSGPVTYEQPLNFGEILHNFGYQHAPKLRQLVDAWRECLARSDAVVASVSPAAHLAARTLGIPSFEISQGFHVPPPVMPSPPLRDWEPAPRRRLEEADRSVLDSMNRTLAAFGARELATLGELFDGRAMLLTFPELDIYPDRGPSDYYGIPDSAEGSALPVWPPGKGVRVFSYLYNYCPELDALLAALRALDMPTLLLCRGIDPLLKKRHAGGPVHFADQPMSVSKLLPQADLVISHASHQMTAQALLAGKPLLLVPTQLEQFLITRRVVRFGAALGIAPGVPSPDFAGALSELVRNPKYAIKAREFAQRYAGQSREAALATMIGRCESALYVGA